MDISDCVRIKINSIDRIFVRSMAKRKDNNLFLLAKGLCYFWKIIGLCPFHLSDDANLRLTKLGVCYSAMLTSTYVFLYSRASSNRISLVLPRETPMTIICQMCSFSLEFLLVISSWCYCIIRERELRSIFKMMKKIHSTTKHIGMSQNYYEIFKRIGIHVFIVNCIWLVLYGCNHGIVFAHRTFRLDIWLPFDLPRVINQNVTVIFINALLVMKKYFFLLNRKIRDLPEEDPSGLRFLRRCNEETSRQGGLKSFVVPGPLEVYGQMHSDLVTITRRIVNVFSLSMLLLILVHLLQMATLLYLLCMRTRVNSFNNWVETTSFVVISCWLLLRFLQPTIIMAISDSTTHEANRTANVLHEMLIADESKKFLVTGQILSLRLLQKQLTIELWGLMEMRLSMAQKMVSMVVIYVTVMMQLDSLNFD